MRRIKWWLAGVFAALVAIPLILGAFPFGLIRPAIERSLTNSLGSTVSIGSVERRQWFSMSPDLVLRNVTAAQPDWAGKGDFLRIGQLTARIPLWPVLLGQGIHPTALEARGLTIALVHDASGRSNWAKRPGNSSDSSSGLATLIIPDGRFTLRDEKRDLILTGQIISDRSGFVLDGEGLFHKAGARLKINGAPIAGRDTTSPYPFKVALISPLLALNANGTMRGALNTNDMSLSMTARAPDLKYLDNIIQAGLFGTQDINLQAKVRHSGTDWLVEQLNGTIGRSRMSGKADIMKREGRSKIEADVHFSQLDFNDLASDEGRARGRALEAQIGPRVLPNTRINLAHVGPTDGVIHFRADKLLFSDRSVFQSLSGDIRLDHKHLTIENLLVGMTAGRMAGTLDIVQRDTHPDMALDLRIEDASLGALLGAPDKVEGPFAAHLRLTGRGDTIRNALATANGHVSLVAQDGKLSRLAAAVLGQDMGKTIGAALGDKSDTVPMRCAAIGFSATNGVLSTNDFTIETGSSLSHGKGQIDLRDETISLQIGGIAREGSGLPIVDPVTIAGTLSAPQLSFAGMDGAKSSTGSAVEALFKSLGAALGLAKKEGPKVTERDTQGCIVLAKRVAG